MIQILYLLLLHILQTLINLIGEKLLTFKIGLKFFFTVFRVDDSVNSDHCSYDNSLVSKDGDSDDSKHNSPEDPYEESYNKKRKKERKRPKFATKYEKEDKGI